MQFSVALLPDHHEELDAAALPGVIAERALVAESAGYDAVFVTDHPAPDTRWLGGGGHHTLEPTVALTFAAGVSTSIRLHTHIYVLAYRNPFLAARALSSLALVSGDRLIVGVAAGYLRPEFAASGVPFDERNERLDEGLDILGRLWAGEVVAGDGPDWTAKGVQHLPAPVTPPPVWIGGNSLAAMRRAVAADGWSPFPTPKGLSGPTKTAEISDMDSLAARVDRFRELCAEAGRPADLDICMAAFSTGAYLSGTASAAQVLEEYAALADLGVTWATVGFPGDPIESLDHMARFAEEIVAPHRVLMTRLVLASGSTYRRRLLSDAGIEADVVVPDFDERSLDDRFGEWGVERYVVEVASGKARSVIRSVAEDAIVLAADQVAVHDGRLLTKPGSVEAAVEQLLSIAGSTHELVNGLVVLRPDGRSASAVDRHVVTMAAYGRDEAQAYVDEFQPLDSVGAYRIEDDAGLLATVEGSGDDGVIGLPISIVRWLVAEVSGG